MVIPSGMFPIAKALIGQTQHIVLSRVGTSAITVPITITATSGSAFTLAAGDISIVNGTVSNFNGSGTSRVTFTASPGSGSGVMSIVVMKTGLSSNALEIQFSPSSGSGYTGGGTFSRVIDYGINSYIDIEFHNGILYLLEAGSRDRLLRIDETTGSQTLVSSSRRFGANIRNPISLVSISGTLYLTAGEGFYSLGATPDGSVTRIGALADYVGKSSTTGVSRSAAIGNTIYTMVTINVGTSETPRFRYILFARDVTKDSGSRVGTSENLGLSSGFPRALVNINNVLYAIVEGAGISETLYRVNITTGIASSPLALILGDHVSDTVNGGASKSPETLYLLARESSADIELFKTGSLPAGTQQITLSRIGSSTISGPITVTASSDRHFSISSDSFSVTGGNVSNLTRISSTRYTFTFTPDTGFSTATIAVMRTGFVSNVLRIPYSVRQSVVLSRVGVGGIDDPITVIATSGSILTLTDDDISITNGTISNFTGSGTARITFTATPSSGSGIMSITVMKTGLSSNVLRVSYVPELPNDVRNLTATSANRPRGQLFVDWDPPSSGPTPDLYFVQWRPEGSSNFEERSETGTSEIIASYGGAALEEDTVYEVRVFSALYVEGSFASTAARSPSFVSTTGRTRALPPAIPTGVTASRSSQDSRMINISWDAVEGATTYNVSFNNGRSFVTISGGDSTSYSILFVNAAQIVVRACNSNGCSNYSDSIEIPAHSSTTVIVATFGAAVVDIRRRTARVPVTFEEAISPLSFTPDDVTTTAPAGVDMTIRRSGPIFLSGEAFEYELVFTLPLLEEGTVTYDITGMVTADGESHSVSIVPGSFTFVANLLSATFEPAIVDNRFRNARVRINFSQAVLRTSFVNQDITVTLTTGGTTVTSEDGFTIVPVDSHRRGDGFYSRFWDLFFSIPDTVAGMITYDITGQVMIGDIIYGVSVDPGSFTFEAGQVTGTIFRRGTTPKGAYEISIAVDNDITGFGTSNINVTNGVASNVSGSGRSYTATITPTADSIDVNRISLIGTVTSSGSTVAISSNVLIVSFNTIQPAQATFENFSETETEDFTIDVNFAGDVVYTGVDATDFQLQYVSGTGLADSGLLDFTISKKTGDNNDYVLAFTPADGISGRYRLSAIGNVQQEATTRTILATPVEFNVRTQATTLGLLIVDRQRGRTHVGNIQLVVFAPDGMSFGGFTTDDVFITHVSGEPIATSGLEDFEVIDIGGGSAYNIILSPAIDKQGSIMVGLSGSVTRGGNSFAIVATSVTVSYDARQAIEAIWTDIDGVKIGNFNIGIDFAGDDPVSEFTTGDLIITRVSGDSLSTMGVAQSDITITADGSGNNYTIAFTPNASVKGVIQIDVFGNVKTGESGSQVTRGVSIPAARITIDTTGTVPVEEVALVSIGFAERPIGVLATEPISEQVHYAITWNKNTGGEFTHANIAIHESTAAGLFNPLSTALQNVGMTGTTTHYRLTYTPPENSKGQVVIEVLGDTFENNVAAYSNAIMYDTTEAPTDEIDINWAIPNETVTEPPFEIVAMFDPPIETSADIIRGLLDVEGVDLDFQSEDDLEVIKDSNMQVTFRILKLPGRFRGNISIGIDTDGLTIAGE